MSRCYCLGEQYTCVTCALRRDRRGRRRDVAIVAVLMAAMVAILGWAQSARATTVVVGEAGDREAPGLAGRVVLVAPQPFGTSPATHPPCQVTGYLEATPRHVTAVFTVAETCREVSLLSWLAPDAHAGNPQVLYDRRSQSDVPPGDYRWTITRPAPGCFFQLDLRVPGHNVDAILGGTHLCQPPSTTTTSTSTSTTSVSTPTTSAPSNPTTTILSSSTVLLPTTSSPIEVIGTPTTPTELPNSGGGELGALTALALGLIGLGRWSLARGQRRAERL